MSQSNFLQMVLVTNFFEGIYLSFKQAHDCLLDAWFQSSDLRDSDTYT